MSDIEIIPAISILNAAVVIADNERYVPLSECDALPDDPLDVVEKLSTTYKKMLLLDINAIEGRLPQMEVIQDMPDTTEIWVDGGIRKADDIYDFFMSGADRVVVSTKSMRGLSEIEKMLDISDELILEIAIQGGVISNDPAIGRLSLNKIMIELGCIEFIISNLSNDYISLDSLPESAKITLFSQVWNDDYATNNKISGRIIGLKEAFHIG